jgi:hypothetical protein
MADLERNGAFRLGKSDVEGVVRLALGSGRAEPVDWHAELLGGGLGPVTYGVYRVSGRALDCGRVVTWTVILKVLSLNARGLHSFFEEESHPLYWKREALAYSSGLLDGLPGGIRAPRCYGVVEKSPGVIWLWLEEVRDASESGWQLDQYERAAACLGRFNGAYLTGRPLPNHPWLVRSGSPRGMLDYNSWIRDIIADLDTWRHPFVREIFPAGMGERLVRLWDGRGPMLAALERAEQTFCHLDAWRMNMVATGRDVKAGGVTMLDWAFPGKGAVGTDAGDLFGESFSLLELDDVEPEDLDRAIFESYVDGLREAGWEGDPRALRCAFTAFCSLKTTFSVGLGWMRDVGEESRYAVWEHIFKRPFAHFARRQAKLVSYLLDMAGEARLLAAELAL